MGDFKDIDQCAQGRALVWQIGLATLEAFDLKIVGLLTILCSLEVCVELPPDGFLTCVLLAAFAETAPQLSVFAFLILKLIRVKKQDRRKTTWLKEVSSHYRKLISSIIRFIYRGAI